VGELYGYIGGYAYDTPAFVDVIRLATELDVVAQIHDESAADIAGFPGITFVLAHLADSPEEVEERIGLAVQRGVLFGSDYTLARSYILRMRLIEITEKFLLRLRTKLLFICFSDRIIWHFSGRS
jgi:hypothetical protein